MIASQTTRQQRAQSRSAACAWAADQADLRPRQKLVLLLAADSGRGDPVRLAERSCMSLRKTRRVVRELRELGYLDEVLPL